MEAKEGGKVEQFLSLFIYQLASQPARGDLKGDKLYTNFQLCSPLSFGISLANLTLCHQLSEQTQALYFKDRLGATLNPPVGADRSKH